MSWKATLTDGSELGEPAIRELWSFRLSIMRLKPHVPPERDFERFARHCWDARRILRLRDERGVLCGMAVPLVYDGTFQGEQYRLVVPEYFYLTPELRGRAVALWAWVRSLVPLTWKRGTHIFLGGTGYPAGALTLDRFLGPVWLYGDAQVPPLASQVLGWIVTHMAGDGWDSAGHQVVMDTLPPPPSEWWLARNQERGLYRRYVERCPQWQEGRTLPLVTQFSTWKVVKSFLHVPRRWWSHHRGHFLA